MEERDMDMAEEKMDREDPRMKERMDMKTDMKGEDRQEGSMDGPHIMDPGEATNKSQDEGKVYDL
jgi:hypothetical protein